MMNFIGQYWQTLLLVLFALVFVVYCIVKHKWDLLRTSAYKLMRIAQKTITGSQKGQARFDQVMEDLYNIIMPPWLKPFISEELLSATLQKWYEEIEDLLDDGKCNDSNKIVKPPNKLK